MVRAVDKADADAFKRSIKSGAIYHLPFPRKWISGEVRVKFSMENDSIDERAGVVVDIYVL